MANFERPHACVPLANSGGQSNFSRSHERAPYINACKRHPSDAAAPAHYLTRPGAQTYAKTYARPFNDGRYQPEAVRGRLSGYVGYYPVSRRSMQPHANCMSCKRNESMRCL
ncbi:hypothetical protein, partial [Burkholderia gladioli]|uniref:hypothetical protein n=1 Tax=Burkholderia gladioli TaxID=28095 RepID=UPI001ABB11AD